ncbi:hypothetical protein WR25_23933 [Diploscapter pachys]|uniref:MADF domain-containing protein n=1 Tax=Diploscapter pachys TaxID=2018661 RepID=A0A2A2JA64_9BILA|nr:hypothetical protein WR25_23933 [Diploscapter pachys]
MASACASDPSQSDQKKMAYLNNAARSRMLNILIENNEFFQPLWDTSHPDFKYNNKAPYYETLKDRLTAEGHDVESAHQLHIQFLNMNSTFRRSMERLKGGLPYANGKRLGKFFVQFHTLYLKSMYRPHWLPTNFSEIPPKYLPKTDQTKNEDINIVDLHQLIKDEIEWPDMNEDSSAPSPNNPDSQIIEDYQNSSPSTSTANIPATALIRQKCEFELHNQQKRKQVTPPYDPAEFENSNSEQSATKKPRKHMENMAETLITLCGEIEAIKPGSSKEIGKGVTIMSNPNRYPPLCDAAKSRMLDIIIEDDTFRPIWDITHAGYKIHNKCPFYEDIRQRLLAENYKVESANQLRIQFNSLNTSFRRTLERGRIGENTPLSDIKPGKFFYQFQKLYVKMPNQAISGLVRSKPIEMNINSVQDPNEIQDPQISNLVDLLQTVKDEFGWNEIEDQEPSTSSPQQSNNSVQDVEEYSNSQPASSGAIVDFSLQDPQQFLAEIQNPRKRHQVTPPLDPAELEISDIPSLKKPKNHTEHMAATLVSLCSEIERTKPGASKKINKALAQLITQATDILYG